MTMGGKCNFEVGDRVRSFRGEFGTIIWTQDARGQGKSPRVQVEWDEKTKNPDKRDYYETVFQQFDGTPIYREE